MKPLLNFCWRFVIVALFIIECNAQNFHFGQFDFSDQRVNPGLVAANNDAEATLLFRNQGTSRDFPIKDTYFALDYPLNIGKKGERWGGIGIYFLNDKQGAGNAFNWDQIGISYSFSFESGANQSLNLGFTGSWNTRKLTFNNLITESQFVGRGGFDPSLFNGEEFGNLAKSFLSLGTGIYWTKFDEKGKSIASLGFGISELNNPNVSLVDDIDRLKPTFTLVSRLIVYQNKEFDLYPELLLYKDATGFNYTIGPSLIFALDRFRVAEKIKSPYTELAIKYGTGQNIMGSIEFGSSDWAVGFNYETGNRNRLANTGSFEVALKYKKHIKPRKTYKRKKRKKNKKKQNLKKSKKKKRSTKISKRRPRKIKRKAFDGSQSIHKSITTREKDEIKKPISTSLEDDPSTAKNTNVMPSNIKSKNIDSAQKVIAVTVKHVVRFEFDTDNIKGDSRLTLENVIKTLMSNPSIYIQLVGHTDSIGKQSYNQALSLRRANSVKSFMLKAGISSHRIFVEGKGETMPIRDNSNLAGRLANRRVAIILRR